MKEITAAEVIRIAKLSRLSLTDAEVEALRKQLSETITFVDVMAQLEPVGEDTKATYQVTPLTNVFREDVVDKNRQLTQEEALRNCEKSYKGFFVVPGIFADEGPAEQGSQPDEFE